MSTCDPEALPDKTSAKPRSLDQHHQIQAAALHRVQALLHPGTRIRYILRSLNSPIGDPHATNIVASVTEENGSLKHDWIHHVDKSFIGVFEAGGEDGDEVGLTISAGLPRPMTEAERSATKTAPSDFGNPIANWMVWKAPILFERIKYLVEKRAQRRAPTKHRFASLERATSRPFGPPLVGERDTTKSPAILIGLHWLEVGGAEKLGLDCVGWARSAGFRVLVIADVPEVQRMADALPDDPDVEFIRSDIFLNPGRAFSFLNALVRDENVVALHLHHATTLYANLLRLKAAFPDLFVIDSTHIVEYADGGYPRISGVWSNYIDVHHVISRELVEFHRNAFGVSEKVKLGRMLPPVNDADLPDPDFQLQTGSQSCRVAFVGRMVHQKRAPLMVEIARKLKVWANENGVDLQVDMVGTGSYLDIVRTLVDRYKLGDTIRLHPSETDVPALLGEADFLVLPSANEGLALVCYEAIANGAIPISTDVGGQSELIPDDLLVPTEPMACVRSTVALIDRLMTDARFLETCKTDLAHRYRDLRRDPTAEHVVTSLYRDILEGTARA